MSTTIRGAVAVAVLALLWAASDAQVLRQLTDGISSNYSVYALDDTGNVVFHVHSGDNLGTNPERSPQLFKLTSPGPVVSQAGNFPQGIKWGTVSVTDDGSQAVVISPSDPIGSNHDRSLELFLVDTDGAGMVQLTDDPSPNAGSVLDARIAGSGNIAAFLADTDPLGTNPDHLIQLFIVDIATLVVTQVTTASTGEFFGFSISDDGERVVFAHDGDPIPNSVTGGTPELFTLVVSISLRKQATVDSSARNPVISGNGEKIAFNDSSDVVVRDWFGATVVIGPGWVPTITDDGAWVYFEAEDIAEIDQIWVADTDGAGPPVAITDTTSPWRNTDPIVSGNNARIAFVTSGGEIGWGPVVMDIDGTNVEDLSVPSSSEGRLSGSSPVISADGSHIVFNSGGLHTMLADGSNVTEISSTSLGAYNVSVSGDGGVIVFESSHDLTGENPDTNRQVFEIHSDGTELAQLGPGDCESLQPTVSADASVVTTFSTCDWTGDNPGNDPDVFGVSLGGSAPVRITYEENGFWKIPQISPGGEWVAYQSPVSGPTQVYRARVDGTGIEPITSDAGQSSVSADISADGSLVAFSSTADHVGTNADHNWEIFVFDAATSAITQLTVTSVGSSHDPIISGDGTHVYFTSDAPIFENVPGEPVDYYRVAVETGLVQRVGGLRDPRSAPPLRLARFFPIHTVAHTGDLAVYSGVQNPTGENNDLGSDVWLVDFSTPARIRPGKATPTVVTWDVEPSPVRYDVIRGDIAEFQMGPGGTTVDLGAVVCLENDSPDATTAGFEDPGEPAPGQAFFFLYRGSQGIDDGPGTWGIGSGDAERIAGVGSCDP